MAAVPYCQLACRKVTTGIHGKPPFRPVEYPVVYVQYGTNGIENTVENCLFPGDRLDIRLGGKAGISRGFCIVKITSNFIAGV
jgi:hypothetical protein